MSLSGSVSPRTIQTPNRKTGSLEYGHCAQSGVPSSFMGEDSWHLIMLLIKGAVESGRDVAKEIQLG